MTQFTTEEKLVCGDSLAELQTLPSGSVELIITSPPYSDQRKNTYGGIKPDLYVKWFLPISEQLHRVLKDDGTFILNIKEKVYEGQRHTYVLELILALKEQGWLWTEEFIWHKKNSPPGKWPNRFRDSWERVLQFNKSKQFTMYQDAVKVPVGEWSKKRLKNLSDTDKIRSNSQVSSGFGYTMSNFIGREMVYPSNVLHLASETTNKRHSAVFPESLPSWFILLFTTEGDTVLDPFVGSGTSCIAAKKLNRNSIGIDILPENIELSRERLAKLYV